MSRLQAVYYRDSAGREPAKEFIRRLSPKRRAALRDQIRRLNGLRADMPHLPFPYSSQVEGELRELRCHVGSELYRILYRRSGPLIVLLHAFRKTTAKVPESEIAIAKKRWEDFKARMDRVPRRPPRPAGYDAP